MVAEGIGGQGDSDAGEAPFGVGLSYRFEDLLLDARVEMRTAFGNDLIPGGDPASLSTWNTSLRCGFEI